MEGIIKDQIKKLYRLSQFSTQISELKTELDQVPEKLGELDQEEAEFRREFDAQASQLEELKKSCRSKETEIADAVESVKVREAKLYMIKTNKEYQAAVTEIAERKRLNKEIESQVLNMMGEIEAIEAKVNEQRPVMDAKSQEFADSKAALEASVGEIKVKLETGQTQWQERTDDIDPELLKRFEEATQFNNDVIALLEGSTCMGCFVNVPPQLVIEVLRMENLHACPSCQRLLLIKESVEDEGIPPPTE